MSKKIYEGSIDLRGAIVYLQNVIQTNSADFDFQCSLEHIPFRQNSSPIAIKPPFYEYEKELRRNSKSNFDVSLRDWLSDKYEIDYIWSQVSPMYGSDPNTDFFVQIINDGPNRGKKSRHKAEFTRGSRNRKIASYRNGKIKAKRCIQSHTRKTAFQGIERFDDPRSSLSGVHLLGKSRLEKVC